MSEDETQPRVKPDAPVSAKPPKFSELDVTGPAYYGDVAALDRRIADGIDINRTDEATGLSALHVAVGTNNLALTKTLVEEHGAEFFADRFGRWPSLIAIECEVSDELSDYIVSAEAQFLGLSDQD
ncbi:ankyrin repeat domain-containing protein [uncultured Ruegeria sp.]|uniref:ankyrin repeat domain-containing protein n=1 Tax=uncultured Ruegeria sp. TaxID=259304 RepID=UPI002620D09F|nr:ankyrin repeat domain-containing protein [uncultured Ruegeria sp.]